MMRRNRKTCPRGLFARMAAGAAAAVIGIAWMTPQATMKVNVPTS